MTYCGTVIRQGPHARQVAYVSWEFAASIPSTMQLPASERRKRRRLSSLRALPACCTGSPPEAFHESSL